MQIMALQWNIHVYRMLYHDVLAIVHAKKSSLGKACFDDNADVMRLISWTNQIVDVGIDEALTVQPAGQNIIS